MAVYCPMYDSMYGWYILVCGPNGCYKQMIVSPLHYYNAMGVKPPVGSKFTPEDFEEFELDLTSLPLSMSTPGGMSTYTMAVPVSFASQAAGAFGPKLDDLSFLQDSLLLPPAGTSSAHDPLYCPLASSLASIPQLPAAVTPSLSSLVPLSYYVDSLSSSANPFGQSLSLPISSYGVMMADPLATSGTNISSNSSLLLHSSVSSGPPSKHKNYKNGQSSYCPKPYSPQPSISSGFKYKYNNLKPSSSFMNLSQLSMSSGSKNHNSLQSASSISNTPPVSSNTKFKNLNPLFSSTSNSKLDYYYPSIPGPSSGKGKLLPSSLGTSYSPVSSAANSSNTKNSFASAYEMYMDGVDESALNDEDYGMSEP